MAAKKRKRDRKKKRTRGQSPHPGVVLRPRTWASGTTTWFARWTCPISGKTTDTNLSTLRVWQDDQGAVRRLTTAEGRRAWAISKSQAIAAQRSALADGRLARGGPRDLADAIADYLERAKTRLRPRTVESYEESLQLMEAWGDAEGVREVRQLTGPLLHRLRDHLAALPRTRARPGGERGDRLEVGEARSAATVNRDIRHVRAFVNNARRAGLCPKLDAETVRESLGTIKADKPRPPFMRPAAVAALLDAAMRHDRQVFRLTRAEKRAGKDGGGTPRHQPAGPIILAAVLSGCRIGELLTLRWDRVHLAGDAGELIITATAAKTRTERAVSLAVCPALARLLAAMRLRCGRLDGTVFGYTKGTWYAAVKRLRQTHGAPEFSAQALRATAGTVLTNAAGIFGGASVFRSARQLGHAVEVAERHYLGLLDLPAEASTVEAALGIEEHAGKIIAAAAGEDLDDQAVDQPASEVA